MLKHIWGTMEVMMPKLRQPSSEFFCQCTCQCLTQHTASAWSYRAHREETKPWWRQFWWLTHCLTLLLLKGEEVTQRGISAAQRASRRVWASLYTQLQRKYTIFSGCEEDGVNQETTSDALLLFHPRVMIPLWSLNWEELNVGEGGVYERENMF